MFSRAFGAALLAALLISCGCGGNPVDPDKGGNITQTLQPLVWDWLNPTPQGQTLTSVDTKNGALIAVGEGGAVLTRGAGVTAWLAPPRPVTGNLEAVVMLTADRALAAGDDGILLSEDGGTTWQQVLKIGTGLRFCSIDADGTNAAAVGDNLLFFSTDSGETWAPASVPSTDNLRGIAFLANNTAVCYASNGDLFRTSDGGAQWSGIAAGQLPAGLVDMAFSSPNRGTAVASFDIFHTEDGGTTWTNVTPFALVAGGGSSVTAIGTPIVAVAFPTPSHGVILTASGQIAESRTSGQSWQQTGAASFPTAAFDLAAVDTSTWTAVGRNGFIAETQDDGANWNERLRGDRGNFVDVAFASDNVGVAIGTPEQSPVSGTLRTLNGGKSWSSQFFAMDDPTAVTFFDDALGIVATFGGVVFRTDDAGASWTDISPPDLPTVSEQYHCVTIFDRQTYLVGGEELAIQKTTDGGVSWRATLSAVSPARHTDKRVPGRRIEGIDFFPGTRTVLAVGRSGAFRSTDVGEVWSSIEGLENSEDVACISATEAIVISNHLILRTNDQGLTWQIVFSLGDAPLTSSVQKGEIEQLNAVALRGRRGIVVGTLGVFLETLDGGVTWNPAQHVTTTNVRGVTFNADNSAIAVGNTGLIIGGRR